MKYIKLISLTGLIAILITSCGKKSELGKMIPKEAAIVVTLNTKSLLSKLSWNEIKQTYWYNELMTDSSIPAASKMFLADPARTGINMDADLVFFVLKPDSNGQAIAQGSMKDGKAFAGFLKNMHPNATVSKDGDLNISKTEETVIGWNEERFVFVTNVNNGKYMDMLNDSATVSLPIPQPSLDSLVSVCKNIFSLSDDNSLYKNEKFAKLEEEAGEIHFWANTNELSKGSMQNMPGMAGMVKFDKFLEENISTATINFQDGKVTANHKQYFGKELTAVLKKGDGNINTDMINRLPSQNLAGVFAMHITPGSILEIIKLTGLDGFINLFLSAQGLSLDDAMRATKGDIVFAVSDVVMKADTANLKELNDTSGNNSPKTDATFLFSVAIGDKDAFNKLTGIGKKMGKDFTQKNTFSKTDDKYYAISNSQDAVNKYFSGTQSTPDFLSQVKDHSMGGFIDIQVILKALQSDFTKDSIGKVQYAMNIAMWNNIYFRGGDYKDGGLVTYGELNLVDKTTNSLQQLNKYIDANAKMIIEKKKKQREEWNRDTTLTTTKFDSAVTKK